MLTSRQKAILIGMLLGDGCLETNGTKVRLRIDHSGSQKDYVLWKFKELEGFTASKPRFSEVYDKRTKRLYQHWRFDTLSLRSLKVYQNLFYSHKRKIVPKQITKLLKSPLTLAVWFMDDGYNRNDCRGMYFNTQAYTLEEQGLLQSCLKNKFNINSKVHWARGKPKIYIPSKEGNKLCKLINPYVIPNMRHKLL